MKKKKDYQVEITEKYSQNRKNVVFCWLLSASGASRAEIDALDQLAKVTYGELKEKGVWFDPWDYNVENMIGYDQAVRLFNITARVHKEMELSYAE